jgi:hypothetical protein
VKPDALAAARSSSAVLALCLSGLRLLLLDRNRLCFNLKGAGGKIEPGTGERRIGIQPQFIDQPVAEEFRNLIFAVGDKDHLRSLFHGFDPGHQAHVIRMPRNARKLADLCPYFNLFTEELNTVSTVDYSTAGCAYRLVSYEQDGTLFSPQIVLQVMLDASGIAHAAGGDDDLRLFVVIDRLRLF